MSHVSSSLVETARRLGLQKKLSQNFLVDETALSAIAQAASAGETTLPVIEIGAGAGFLSQKLMALGHALTAIEIDPKMAAVLKEQWDNNPQFTLLHQDVRKVDMASLLPQRGIIVGNIPYHLTGPILFQLVGELAEPDYPLRRQVARIVLMVQKEVGERLVAQPGQSAYSQLTVQSQYWFNVSPVCVVPKKAFVPPPKVDSMVVLLTPRETPAVSVASLSQFSRLVKAVFMHRRKTLLNNLKMSGFGESSELGQLLESLGLSEKSRAQELSIEQLGALSNALGSAI